MLFNADFFTDSPTFQHYARRGKTRNALSEGLSVFADMALKVGSLKVPKGDFMASSGMSERTLNYYGGIKGISYILHRAASDGCTWLTADQASGLRQIGIALAGAGYNDALLTMKADPGIAMRRVGWPEGNFVMLETEEGGDVLVMITSAGAQVPYTLSLADMQETDWVRLH